MPESLDLEKALKELESAYMELSYKAERLMGENETMREQLAKIKFAATSLEAIKNATRIAFKDPYFWCGYFLSMAIMVLVGLLWKGKEK